MPRVRALALEFLEKHPLDCARILENIPVHSACSFFHSIRPGPAAAVIEKMVTMYGAECIQCLDIKTAASVISEMKPAQAARLLRAMNPQTAGKFLDILPPYSRNHIQKALRYPEQTVGRLMDSNPFSLSESILLSEALRRVKRLKNHTLHEVFIVDDDHKLTGALRITDLLSSDRSSPVQTIMAHSVPFLSVRSSLKSAAQYSGWQNYSTLPVVEQDHTLVGILKSSAVMNNLGKYQQEPQPDNVLNEVFSMTKMYWIVMAELMGAVAGEEMYDKKAGEK
jgi:magnesium transporter